MVMKERVEKIGDYLDVIIAFLFLLLCMRMIVSDSHAS